MHLETELLEITGESLSEAQFMASNFIDVSVQNRVFFNVIGAESVISYLGKMGIDVENISCIHSIKRVVEKIDVADIILDNIHIDVRVVFDETEIFIPKSHYELGLVPDIYAVLKYDKSFQRINFIGFIEPSEINLNNSSDDYYFVEPTKLKTPFDMLDFINNFKGKTDKNLSDAQILRGRELSVSVADHDVTEDEFKEYISLLVKSNVLRNSVLEYDNFETLASKVARSLQISKEQRERDSEIVDFDSFINLSDENNEPESENKTENEIKEEQTPKDLNGDDLLDDLVDGSTKVIGAAASGAAMVAGAAAAANTLGANAVSKEAMDLAGMAGDIVIDEAEKLLDKDSADTSDATDFLDDVSSETNETETVNSDDVQDLTENLTTDLSDELIDEAEQEHEVSEVTQQEDEISEVSVEETQDSVVQDNIDEQITDIETELQENQDTEFESQTAEDTLEDRLSEDSFDDDLADFPSVEDTDETVADKVSESTHDSVSEPEKIEETDDLDDLGDIEINEDLDLENLNFDEIEISEDLISEETPAPENISDESVTDDDSEAEEVSDIPEEPENITDMAESAEDIADSAEETDNITEVSEETSDAAQLLQNEDLPLESEDVTGIEADNENDFSAFDIGDSLDIDGSDAVTDLFDNNNEFDFDDFAQTPTGEIAGDFEITEEPSDNQTQALSDELPEETSETVSEEPSDVLSDELFDEVTESVEEPSESEISNLFEDENTADEQNIDEVQKEDVAVDNTDDNFDSESETEHSDELADNDDLENFNPFADDSENSDSLDKNSASAWDGEFTDVIEPDPEGGDDDLVITTEPKHKDGELVTLDSDSEFESVETADIGMELPVFVPPENSGVDIDNEGETHNFDELPTEKIEELGTQEDYGLVNFSDLADVPTAEPYNAEVNFADVEEFANFETIAPIDDSADVDYFVEDMDISDLPDVYAVKENSVVISDKTHVPGEIFIDINRDSSRVDMSPTNEHLEELYNNNNVIADESGLNNGVRIMNEKGKSVPIILGIGGIALVVIIAGIIMLSVSKFMNPSQNGNEQPINDNIPQNNNFGDDVPNMNVDNNGVILNDNQPQTNVPQQPSGVVGMNGGSGQINPSQQPAAQVQHTAKPIPPTSFLSVKKLSWEVPDYVSADSNFRLYFQSAGKSLKASLSSDLLLATDYTYSNQIKISVLYSKDGAFQKAKILLSSGSAQVDNIVLQSVNQTLRVLKAPNSLGNDQSTTLILKIYL